MDIGFLITTCNRKDSCQRLVDVVSKLGTVYVFNDGGVYTIDGAVNAYQKSRQGKKGYYKTVNYLFGMRGMHRYYIMIPDDFNTTKEGVEEAVALWDSIEDKDKVCLNLYADRVGEMCWTSFKPIDKDNMWLTQWVDMCFICEQEFFNAVGYLPPMMHNLYSKSSMNSSGVGAYISRILHKKGKTMYQVKKSLVYPQPEHGISQMHKR